MDTLKIAALFDRQIPEILKNKNDPRILTKAKVLMALYLSTTVIIVVMAAFLLLFISKSNADWMHGVAASLVTLLLLSLEVLIFYKSGNINISAIIFSTMFFVTSFGAVVITGGWHSPVLLLFFCAPVVSFLVGGRGEGIYVASLVFFCGIALMIAHQLDFTLFQIIAEENIEYIRYGIWIASSCLMTACLTLYDFLLEGAINKNGRNNRI